MITKEQVFEALKECFDPEIPINIVDLGLIYDVDVKEDLVYIKMTLTTPGCGMARYIAQDAKNRILAIDGVKDATVEIVWDPPWDPSRLSEAAKKQLGWE